MMMTMNTAPYEWTIYSLEKHFREGPYSEIRTGEWVPARPYGLYSLSNRFRLAWMVFTGKADALRWPEQMPKAY
jgi:hypothetical protein